MQTIHLLSQTLQNQIAAGEVVERPASIVKEIVENSIDAGSSQVDIEIEQGGIKKIRVVDNGEGMSPEDTQMAFTRYATSKISTVEDLFTLHSFGFRGEAIASIASVSNMTIRSKKAQDETGTEVINGEDSSPCAMQNGTEIIVENLFWNVPARRKFLKSENTESREIIKIIEAFALANPQISFRLKKDGKEAFFFSGNSGENALQNRVQEVLGKDISSHLLPLRYDGQEKISGFITHPNFHRSSRDRQFFFVNKRVIYGDSTLGASLSQSYQSLMPKGKFPAGVIFLDLPPDLVDVNVHPRKTQVKFTNPSHIFQILKNTFVAALSNNTEKISPNVINPSFRNLGGGIGGDKYPESSSHYASSSPTPSSSGGAIAQTRGSTWSSTPTLPSYNHSVPQTLSFSNPESENGEMENVEANSIRQKKIIGQARNSFIIVEEKDGIRIIDQHAAHERVRYEELLRNFRAKTPVSQPLLTPQIFSLSHSEKEKILDSSEDFSNLGFSIEDFGGQEIAVTAVPSGNENNDIEKIFRNLLDDLDTFDPSFGENINSIAEKIISYSACRGAKKFGDKLNMIEMERLLEDWENCSHPEACAHGRPVSTFYSFSDMENECGRY
jgi:DNA mismatch repair protein MutL